MKAIWNGTVIAESDDTVVVEGNHYFPAESVDASLLRPSDIRRGAADPTLAARRLHWQAQHDVDQVIGDMCLAAQTASSRNA